MVAKISDFGLSKSYINVAQSHISLTAAGTLGYIDPEFVFIPLLLESCIKLFGSKKTLHYKKCVLNFIFLIKIKASW